MACKKQKKELPVVIIEDHNEALRHIYRAIGSKRIPFKEGAMIHFDSHPDMMIPKDLNMENIYDKDHVLNSVSIENWIMPAICAGHFSYVAWMKPPWATQLPNGVHDFSIGVERHSKQIKVSCAEPYFVSELAWCPDVDLENPLPVYLEVYTLGEPLQGEGDSAAVAVPKTPQVLSPEFEKKLQGCPYVLDIDLDFYSTRNPFLSLFTEEQFGMLRELYHYDHPKLLTDETLKKVTLERQEQLSELESIFKSSKDNPISAVSPRLEAARRLLATFPGGVPPDPGLLNDAGCTCDDCDLPHHVSTRDQVRHLVGVTKEFLSSLPVPALVTISRSTRDDYCPAEDVNFIQELVLDMLKNIFGALDITTDYEEEDTEQGTSTSA